MRFEEFRDAVVVQAPGAGPVVVVYVAGPLDPAAVAVLRELLTELRRP